MRLSARRFVALASAVAAGGFILAGGVTDRAGAVPVAQTIYVTGTGPGGGPHVKVFSEDAVERASFFAYGATFSGGVNVALGDLNGDDRLEIITGAGPGGGPHVRVFTDHGGALEAWSPGFAYPAGFTGGVNVAASDVNNDGDDEIIVAPQTNGGPHVKIYDIVNNAPTLIAQFFAYNESFQGGVNLASLDGTNGKTFAVAPGRGGGPHVKACNAGGCDGGFFAYLSNYFGGITITDLPNEGDDVIITGSMENAGHVRAFELDGTSVDPLVSFFAFPGTNNGVSLAGVADPNSDAAVVVAPYRGVGAVNGRDFAGDVQAPTLNPYPGFPGGVRIAVDYGSFDNTPVTTTTSTSTTSTTVPSTTTSTTVPPTTTTTEAPTTTTSTTVT